MNLFKKITLAVRTIQNLPLLFLDFGHVLKGDILYTTKNGILFITRSGTPDVAEVILVASGQNYPLTLTSLSYNPVIIDLGTHIGSFTLFAWKYFFRLHPKIYSYEPDPENFSYLQTNIFMNKADHMVTAFNEAVSSYTGKAYLQTDKLSNDQYFISSKHSRGAKTTNVVSLPHIVWNLGLQHIDILKIDIEGEEYALFNDPKTLKLLKNSVRYIFVESHDVKGKSDRPWIKEKLSDFQLLHENVYVLVYKNPRHI